VINYLITPALLGVQFHGESLDGARFAMQTSASAFTQMEAVASGVGIAELPCCVADEHPQIERVWPNERPTMRTVWLVTHVSRFSFRRPDPVRFFPTRFQD
jgi:DNA-binding transcriptional LysR family regulator